ncbi:EamA family transporter [Frankia sp. CiP3]|uniref:EamA family transporter n=1 Tax=Frankia sp. CiP3 TaxID=2880971 RepID=UPI001EF609EB|nr:EamA family transporter [Frankia sp. CiP3]
MSRRDTGLALVTVFIWGVNFVAIDYGLRSFPPLLFAALRFLLVALPAMFFVSRPRVAWRWLCAIGLLTGVGQFGLLFTGMHLGVPAGLAALVLQSQALFTLVFSVAVLREKPRRAQVAGIVLASLGIAVIGWSLASSVRVGAFLLVVAAGACWAGANIATRFARPDSGFGLVVWSSLLSPLPLALLSMLLEGPGRDRRALTGFTAQAGLSLLFVVLASTLLAFGLWNHLLARHPAHVVAPYSLLVPVVGFVTSWLLLGEAPTYAEVGGGVTILMGLLAVTVRRADVPAAVSASVPADERIRM